MDTKTTLIVAELSANHNGSLATAVETVRAAARVGADAVKLQTYTADTITLDCRTDRFRIDGGPWDGRYLHDLYNEAYTPWAWHGEIFRIAREEGMLCFSAPFDPSAVDFLETLGNPIYKIASFEITDIPLIEYVAAKGKPVMISTGIAAEIEIAEAVEACRRVGNAEVILLKCTSSYPATAAEANLAMIADMRVRFGCPTGLSDHTLGDTVALASVALGATVVEKHFILSRAMGGPDAGFSMEPAEFAQMAARIREVEQSLGKVSYDLSEKTLANRRFSRSLFVTEDIKRGEIFTSKTVRSVRPAGGLSPKYLPVVLGKRASCDIERGTPLSATMIAE
ncbi:MAG: pseudaminic acid synthase [Rikenellaceae bacterium]|jgi:pseudaminic acid synthase|nr:pseudaminic acid synthase [Rikenellaceae bacterium]